MGKGWLFNAADFKSSAMGGAFRNPLEGSGDTREAKLAREAIQNSCDAGNTDEAVKVVFRRLQIVGDNKAALIEQLQMDGKIADRIKELRLPQDSSLLHIHDLDYPLPLLIVEDLNTTGLTGDPSNPDSAFFRCIFSLGDESKAFDQGSTGGSFGFGKSVFCSLSDAETFFAYSVIDPTGTPDGAYSRFIGASFFAKHSFEDQTWTGRAWFGKIEGDEPLPLLNEEADKVAAALGCTERGTDTLGTSVVIFGFDADMQSLRRGIEDSWWPRLIEQNLTVELWDGDSRLESPRPKKRPDLRPFIESYELAVGRTEPTSEKELQREPNRLTLASSGELLRLGAIGAKLIDPAELGDSNVAEERGNRVALIRDQRMVVQYLEVKRRSAQVYVGTFVAHEDVEKYLRISEPPAHDIWSPSASRLKDVFGDEGPMVVKAVLDRIKSNVASWLSKMEDVPTEETSRISSVDRIFGSFLGSLNKGNPPPPPPVRDPIHLEVGHPEIRRSEGSIELVLAPKIGLRDDSDVSEATARVSPVCYYLFDSDLRKGDPVPIKIREQGQPDWSLDPILVALQKGQTVVLEVETDPFDARCAIDYEIHVESAT